MTTVYNKNGVAFDIDAIVTDLNGKMDRDGVNALASVCVESYTNGTSWYRIYSDGWCEQGGQTPHSADALYNVSFLQPFNTANPAIQLSRRYYFDGGSTTVNIATTGIQNVSASGFTCYDNGWSGSGGSVGIWQACGYIR